MKILLVQRGSEGIVLRQALVDSSWPVTGCDGLEAARERQTRDRFPIVVIDLPETSEAEQLGRWLRQQPLGTRTFILLSIPPEDKDHVARLLEECADEVIYRPQNAAELQLRWPSIRRQIQLRREWHEREDALNSRAQQQVAIAALGQAALSQDLPTLFDLAGKLIIYTIEVDFFSVLERTGDGPGLKFLAGFGWREGRVGLTLPDPIVGSLTGRTLLGEDCFLEDMAGQRQFEPSDFMTEDGAVGGLSVAIKAKERGVFGVLGAYTTSPRVFKEDELRFMEGLANVLGAAMERQRIDAEIQRQQSQVQHLQRLESVGQLAAGLAHDYNNVLTIIHGHVTLALGDSSLAPRLATSLKTVLDAVERAAGLTRQMLSFSRKQSMQSQPLDLNEVVQSVVKLLDRVLGRNIRLKMELAEALPAVQADAGMLDQVLMNLAVNARDAMPKGGELTVATSVVEIRAPQQKRHPDATEGEFVCLRVADTGCGMDANTLRRIFDPFFTTKEPGKGTGLGLSTVYGIVKQHKGWVEVESEVGRGTAFRAFLPSLGKPLERPKPELELVDKDLAAESRGDILLVEDEPTLRELAKLLLDELGHRVIEAGTGVEALRAWSENNKRIQLLLTDLVLPDGITGFDLAERFLRERPELHVVFTSGYSADKVKAGLPPDRPFHFLQKPYRAESLAQVIREATGQRRAGRAS